jgi:hypothetical protein
LNRKAGNLFPEYLIYLQRIKLYTMKLLRTLTVTLPVLLVASGLLGQKPVVLIEKQVKFSHGEYTGLSLTIPEVKYNDVSKAWTKILEKGTKSKIQIENGELTIFGAKLSEVYPEPINLYCILSTIDSAVILEATYELKPKLYLSKDLTPAEYSKARDMMFNFGKDLYISLAEEELKREEKALKKAESDLNSLQNSKEKLEKSIVSDNTDIEQLTNKIALLRQDASNYNDQLVKEREALPEIVGEEAKASKEKEIANLEKSKEKALRDIEDSEKKILLRKSDIERSKLDIESNLQNQQLKLADVDRQKQITLHAENKLKTIMGYE